MCNKNLILLAILLLLNLSILNAQIKPMGLQPLKIKSISLSQSWASPSQILVAASADSGVYFYYLGMDCGWQNLGLKGKQINDVYTQVNGAGPMDYYKIYACMRATQTDSSLIYTYSIDLDTTWSQADSGLSPTPYSWVADMDGQDYSGHEPPAPVYAAVDGLLYHLTSHWEQIPFEGPFTEFVQVFNDSLIWTGGSGAVMWPVLFKSPDGGNNWYKMDDTLCYFGCDNSCLSLTTVPDHPDTVYLGMSEHVLKSTDGGAHWHETGLKDIDAGFYSISVNPLNSEHIITYSRAETSVVYESFNGGVDWKIIPNPISSFKINEMSAGVFEQEFMVFFATAAGVFSYKTTPDRMPDQPGAGGPKLFSIRQNYPNPFNSNTIIRYRLSKASWVNLTVFDALGRKVKRLVNQRQEAAMYSVRFDGSTFSSGIYYYRLLIDNRYTAVKKMLYLR